MLLTSLLALQLYWGHLLVLRLLDRLWVLLLLSAHCLLWLHWTVSPHQPHLLLCLVWLVRLLSLHGLYVSLLQFWQQHLL